MPNPISYRCKGRTGYLLRFKRPDNQKRTTLRLGVIAKKRATEFGHHIDTMLECLNFGDDYPAVVNHWLSRMAPDYYEKLVRCGLVLRREAVDELRLAPFLKQYYELKTGGGGRSGGWKDGTARWRKQSMLDLQRYFGDDRPLTMISAGDAEDWFRWLQVAKPKGRGLASASAAKKLKDARQFFNYAQKKNLIAANPFTELKAHSQDNPGRLCEVTVETVMQVMDQINDPEFRAVVVLARFAGLRIPSEIQSLRWRDIDFSERRLHLHSPKTEHHRDAGRRICPLFEKVIPSLEALQPDQPNDDDFVFQRLRDASKNLRTQLVRYVKAAGLEPWPKPFQNLRANALTDLADRHPIHTVCKWLGNTPEIAQRHYLIIKKQHYELPQQSDRPPSSFV